MNPKRRLSQVIITWLLCDDKLLRPEIAARKIAIPLWTAVKKILEKILTMAAHRIKSFILLIVPIN